VFSKTDEICLIVGILEDEKQLKDKNRHKSSEVRTAEYHLRPQVVKKNPSEIGAKCGPHMNCAAAEAGSEQSSENPLFKSTKSADRTIIVRPQLQLCGPQNSKVQPQLLFYGPQKECSAAAIQNYTTADFLSYQAEEKCGPHMELCGRRTSEKAFLFEISSLV